MNVEQVKSAIRWIIATFGPFLIAHGYATDATLPLISGVLMAVAALAWGMFTHTEANAVTVVDTIAKQPSTTVKAVILEPTAAGRDLAASIPGNTTVVAGTVAAEEISKS